MARKQQAPVITARMYKQFAIATVLVTGTVALMADGEKREVIASEITNMEIANPEPSPPQLMIRKEAPRQNQDMSGFYGNTGSDTPSDAGVQSSHLGGSGSSDIVDSEREFIARTGMTRDEFDQLSEDEKRRLLQLLGMGPSSEARAERAEALRKASIARSGSTPDADR